MKKYILLFLVSIFIFSLNAKSQDNPEEVLEPFFEMFKNDMGKAIDYLFSTNELIEGNQEGITTIKNRLDMSRKLLGNYYGHELIKLEEAGESYLRYTYSLKYDRQPVKLIIIMYKSNDHWKIQNINFDDKVEGEFREI